MFEATLENAAFLKKMLETIKELVGDANFDCSPQGFSLQAMDSSHVSLVAMMIYSHGFTHYRCDRATALGVNLPNFAKMIKCAGNDDTVSMIADDGGEKLQLKFSNDGKERNSSFVLKLLDIDTESLTVPDQKYAATVQMPSSEFQRIVRDMSMIGETVLIRVIKGQISFSVEGEMGSGEVTLRNTSNTVDADEDDENKSTTIMCTDPVELKFALRYLNLFARASVVSDKVVLSLQPSVPISVEYQSQDLGFLRFYLAPKIDE